MKEIRSIVNTCQSIDFSQTRAVLATVARVEGSSYRRAGARMLVLDNGTYLGGISGGCLEGDALRRAQKAIHLGKASVITYDTTQEDGHQIGVGLGCNGIIDVLFTPLDPQDQQNPVRLLSTLTSTREPAILVTVVDCPENINALGKTLLFENEGAFASAFPMPELTLVVVQDIRSCIDNQVSKTVSYSTGTISARIFIELIQPATHLVIYGGNYDIYSLVRIAGELGWDTTVVTDIAKVNRSLVTGGTRLIQHKGAESPMIDAYTAVLLMAHDYATDFNNLQLAIPTKTFYIGLLGPRKRAEKMFDALRNKAQPLPEENMERIFAPAGLDIGAATPEEIALSIAAEIRSRLAGRQGTPLRSRPGTIYGNEK